MANPDPVFDVCDCPEPVTMYWQLPDGEWIAAYPITSDRNVEADAAEYHARQVSAFVVRCPRCRRTYARGIT